MVNTLGILGLLLGIAAMILFSMRGLSVVPLTLLASALVCIFNGVDLWTGFLVSWAGGLGGSVANYFLLFFVSTCFANLMDYTGSCIAIANKFLGWFGKKHILTGMSLLVLVLCYGGVNIFVIVFAVAPIMFRLFEELNIPRKLTCIPLAIGAQSWVMNIPGNTQINNVIPTAMGTSLTAAPVMGSLMCIAGVAISLVYAETVYRKEMALVSTGAQIGWTGDDNAQFKERTENLPGAVQAFIPMVVLVAIAVGGSLTKVVANATQLAILATVIAFVVCFIINNKYIVGKKSEAFKAITEKSATAGIGSVLALGAVVGFGSVVSSAASFQEIVQWLISLDINVYWKGVISTGIISGVTGSASSGVRLVMEYLGDYFINSGCNLDILHRLISFAGTTLDSLPHCSGIFVVFGALGITHKSAYKYQFVICTVFTTVVTVVATLIVTLIGM